MKILLCTDGSLNGLRAVRLGGVIAAQMQAEVTLLCVVENKRHNVEDSLNRATAVIQRTVDIVQTISRSGELVDVILAQLLQAEYDLVVVGYHLRSFLEKIRWGSLAARIAHELPVSVLIVRGRREWIKQVLIGISSGGFAGACADWGGRIAAAFGARATLLHVSPPPPLMYGGFDEVVESLSEFLETDTPGAHSLRQVVATLTELDVQTDVELARGLPERELLRLAQNRDVDLIVIGSSWAAQPAHRLFVRNITEQVLINTQRPVLVVRPSER